MRWNPNDNGIVFNPEGRCVPDHHGKHAPATSPARITSKFFMYSCMSTVHVLILISLYIYMYVG